MRERCYSVPVARTQRGPSVPCKIYTPLPGTQTTTFNLSEDLMLTYKITDGNRPAMLVGEKRDCTVRACSLAFNIPYENAWIELMLAGRKTTKGMWGFEKYLQSKGLSIRTYNPRITLENWVVANPIGTFIVHKRGHAIAVINGIIHDSFQASPRVFVDYAVKIL